MTAAARPDPSGEEIISIGVIAGDGIGPELVASARSVLDAALRGSGTRLHYVEEDGGADTYRRTGANLSAAALQRIRDGAYRAVLKGPVGLPDVLAADGTEAGLLGGVLRIGLDTYANVRPIRMMPGVSAPVRRAPGEIDYVVVRENTEGLYLSRGLGVGNDHAVADQLLVTRPGVERVARFAFRLARTRHGAPADGIRRVTVVDKSNVLRSYAFFRQVTREVAEEFADIELDFRYADAAAHDLVIDPRHFDVVVTENFLGDILSDLGAATVGGLGLCPAANIGDQHAYFEPIHGSAPDIAGQDMANPISQVLAAAMMLDHLDRPEPAARIRAAVEVALTEGSLRVDERGRPRGGTQAATDAILARLSGS